MIDLQKLKWQQTDLPNNWAAHFAKLPGELPSVLIQVFFDNAKQQKSFITELESQFVGRFVCLDCGARFYESDLSRHSADRSCPSCGGAYQEVKR
jgi:rubrerythrin